jgi:hypothetical protein
MENDTYTGLDDNFIAWLLLDKGLSEKQIETLDMVMKWLVELISEYEATNDECNDPRTIRDDADPSEGS